MKKILLLSGFFCSVFMLTNAQCPNPVSCGNGTNGDNVYVKLNGTGGLQTYATFTYDRGICLFNKPVYSSGGTFSSDGTNNLLLQTNGTTRMTILGSNGYVGIGKTPSVALDVNGIVNSTNFTTTGSLNFAGNILSGISGSNGDIVSLQVDGRGGLKTYAIFDYNSGISFDNQGGYTSFKSNGTTAMTIWNNNVGIGCTNPGVKLAVNGKIQATEVEIKTAPCSDFVFEKDYSLMTLKDLEEYVNTYKHLPEIPSAEEFAANGYNVGTMDDLLLRKIEELTLYIIDLEKRLNEVESNSGR